MNRLAFLAMSFAVSFAVGSATLAQPAFANDVIEAYGVPATLLGAPCAAVPYAPIPAYAAVGGKVLGQLVLDHPEYVKETTESCSDLPLVQLQIEEYTAPVAISEWSYETNGIGLYALAPVADDATQLWTQAKADGRAFWIKLPIASVKMYEELAYLPQDLTVVCTAPGQCAPAEADFTADLARSKGQVQSCYDEAYTIVGRASANGLNYYELKREELNGGSAAFPHLPETIYIPTRSETGQHTGYFYSRGC